MSEHKASLTRRQFINESAAVAGALTLSTAALSGCGDDSTESTSPGGGFDVGAVDDFVVGQNRSLGNAMPTARPIIVRRTTAGIGAFSNSCTHANCEVFNGTDSSATNDPTLSGFYCFCHSSIYDDEGRVTQPATGTTSQAPLPWFQVTITDGRVLVDTSTSVALGTYTPVS